MNNTILLQKLIAIEKSIGMADNGTIRSSSTRPKITCFSYKRTAHKASSWTPGARTCPVFT